MKRSITLGGHDTSVTLEDEFWDGLRSIARSENTTLTSLVAQIDRARRIESNLSSAIRVFVLNHFRANTDDSQYKQADAFIERAILTRSRHSGPLGKWAVTAKTKTATFSA